MASSLLTYCLSLPQVALDSLQCLEELKEREMVREMIETTPSLPPSLPPFLSLFLAATDVMECTKLSSSRTTSACGTG